MQHFVTLGSNSTTKTIPKLLYYAPDLTFIHLSGILYTTNRFINTIALASRNINEVVVASITSSSDTLANSPIRMIDSQVGEPADNICRITAIRTYNHFGLTKLVHRTGQHFLFQGNDHIHKVLDVPSITNQRTDASRHLISDDLADILTLITFAIHTGNRMLGSIDRANSRLAFHLIVRSQRGMNREGVRTRESISMTDHGKGIIRVAMATITEIMTLPLNKVHRNAGNLSPFLQQTTILDGDSTNSGRMPVTIRPQGFDIVDKIGIAILGRVKQHFCDTTRHHSTFRQCTNTQRQIAQIMQVFNPFTLTLARHYQLDLFDQAIDSNFLRNTEESPVEQVDHELTNKRLSAEDRMTTIPVFCNLRQILVRPCSPVRKHLLSTIRVHDTMTKLVDVNHFHRIQIARTQQGGMVNSASIQRLGNDLLNQIKITFKHILPLTV